MKKVDIGNTTNSLTHYIGHQKADINTVIESQRKTTIKEKRMLLKISEASFSII